MNLWNNRDWNYNITSDSFEKCHFVRYVYISFSLTLMFIAKFVICIYLLAGLTFCVKCGQYRWELAPALAQYYIIRPPIFCVKHATFHVHLAMFIDEVIILGDFGPPSHHPPLRTKSRISIISYCTDQDHFHQNFQCFNR